MRDSIVITKDNFRSGAVLRPQAAPDRLVPPEQLERRLDEERQIINAEQKIRAESEFQLWMRQRTARADTVRRRFTPARGETVEACLAVLRACRSRIYTPADIGPVGLAMLPSTAPPEPLPLAAAAAAAVEKAEREFKRATRALSDAEKKTATASAEAKASASRAEKAEADAADIARRLDAEREREGTITAAGDLDAAEKWAAGVAELERRHALACKVAMAKRSQAEATARDAVVLEGEVAAALVAALHEKAQLVGARLMVATVATTATIAKTMAPLVSELDQLLVEVSAAGQDADDLYLLAERVGAALRAAALDG